MNKWKLPIKDLVSWHDINGIDCLPSPAWPAKGQGRDDPSTSFLVSSINSGNRDTGTTTSVVHIDALSLSMVAAHKQVYYKST